MSVVFSIIKQITKSQLKAFAFPGMEENTLYGIFFSSLASDDENSYRRLDRLLMWLKWKWGWCVNVFLIVSLVRSWVRSLVSYPVKMLLIELCFEFIQLFGFIFQEYFTGKQLLWTQGAVGSLELLVKFTDLEIIRNS